MQIPKRVKKFTIWVGEKKGREEDDDDDARMLDEFPTPHLSPLCKFLVEKGFYYKKFQKQNQIRKRKKREFKTQTRSSTM
jgi:hypothetical protein